MSLSFGVSPLFLIPCAVIAGLLAFWVYYNTVPRVSRPKQTLLTLLRFTSLFLILFLLFEPILQNLIRTEHPPALAVLVDDSQSLTLHGSSEGDSLAKAPLMEEAITVFSEESIPGDIHYFTFSDRTSPISSANAAITDSLQFGGERTNMSQALDYVRDHLKDENLQGFFCYRTGNSTPAETPLFKRSVIPSPYIPLLWEILHKRKMSKSGE